MVSTLFFAEVVSCGDHRNNYIVYLDRHSRFYWSYRIPQKLARGLVYETFCFGVQPNTWRLATSWESCTILTTCWQWNTLEH